MPPIVRPSRSLRARVGAAVLAAVLVMLAVVGLLVAWQGPVGESLHLVHEGYLPLSKQVARLRQDQARVQRDLTRLSRGRPRPVSGDTSTAEIYTEELRDSIEIARVIVDSMRAQARRAEEAAVLSKTRAYLDGLDQLFARYEAQSQAWLGKAGVGAAELDEDRKALRTTEKQLGDELDQLEATLDGRITALVRASEQAQARARALAVGAVALLVVGGLALVRAIQTALDPIGRLTAEVVRVAGGEYDRRIEVTGDDEVAVLASELNAMAAAIAARDRSLQERAADLDRLSRYLTSVVDSLEDGLIVVEHGVVSLANPAASRAWQVGMGLPAPAALAASLATPGTWDLAGAGDTRWSVRSVSFGEDGVVAVLTDVTDAVRAQDRLARTERLALVGQMLAQITHEVRNPLNALSLNVELLADEIGELDPARRSEAHATLAMITREVDRLTALTGHYLQLARRPPPAAHPVSPDAVIADAVRLVEPEAVRHGATLVVTGGAPPQLLDGDQLRQAVLNLVRNALQAGARRVEVRLEHDPHELRVVVADDGPGMSVDDQARATEPFFTTKASGTGLGLTIVRQIAEDHGGELRIVGGASGSGGMTVTLALPARTGIGEPVG